MCIIYVYTYICIHTYVHTDKYISLLLMKSPTSAVEMGGVNMTVVLKSSFAIEFQHQDCTVFSIPP